METMSFLVVAFMILWTKQRGHIYTQMRRDRRHAFLNLSPPSGTKSSFVKCSPSSLDPCRSSLFNFFPPFWWSLIILIEWLSYDFFPLLSHNNYISDIEVNTFFCWIGTSVFIHGICLSGCMIVFTPNLGCSRCIPDWGLWLRIYYCSLKIS